MTPSLRQAGPADRKFTFGYWLPVAAGLAVMYVPTYVDLSRGLWLEDAYAHGPIILALFAWLVWRQRELFSQPNVHGNILIGAALLAVGLIIYIVGRSQNVPAIEVGSQIPVIAGTVLALRGQAALKKLWFAIFFLLFLIPLPGFIIEHMTGPLKSLVSQVIESVLYAAGYPIARSGVMLTIGQYQLLIADACSGLNSIYSLSALGLFYLYLTHSVSRTRQVLLLLSIVPIAIVANMIRVLALVLVTYHFGDEAGQSFLHGLAGMVLFVTALLLLLGFDGLLRKFLPKVRAQ